MPATINCTACGNKMAMTRQRCPRCLTPMTRMNMNVTSDAARSRQLARIAAGMLAVFLIMCAGVYLAQPSTASDARAVRLPDPLAARRQPPAVAAVDDAPDLQAPVPQRSPFDPGVEGMEAYHKGELEGALEPLTAAVAEYPEDAEARTALAQVLAGLGHLEEAIPHLQEAVTINPGRSEYHAVLARTLAGLQRWDEAVASYQKARAILPDDDLLARELADVLQQSGDDGES